MPRLSGLAILVAVEVAGWIWLPGDGESRSILLGAVAIAAVGVVDDVRGLAALPKLVGQIAAALDPGRSPGSGSTTSPCPSSAASNSAGSPIR